MKIFKLQIFIELPCEDYIPLHSFNSSFTLSNQNYVNINNDILNNKNYLYCFITLQDIAYIWYTLKRIQITNIFLKDKNRKN